jgi:hypothetical protein
MRAANAHVGGGPLIKTHLCLCQFLSNYVVVSVAFACRGTLYASEGEGAVFGYCHLRPNSGKRWYHRLQYTTDTPVPVRLYVRQTLADTEATATY